MERRTQNAERRTKTAGLFARSSVRANRSSLLVPGFTLTEIMVVIVIIVLMLAMAMPVFRVMTGSRSEESASNQIAAMLGVARSEAIGLQETRGVAFFLDSDGLTNMALVQRVTDAGNPTFTAYNSGLAYTHNPPSYIQYSAGAGSPTYYYVASQDVPPGASGTPSSSGAPTAYWTPVDTLVVDKVTDSDIESLPKGIGVQLLNDWGAAAASLGGTTPRSDAYVSTGVIFFDSQGRLTNQQFSIAQQGHIGSAISMAATKSTNYPEWTGNPLQPPTAGALYATALYSSFGLVLFDKEAFQAQNFDTLDPTYSPSVSSKSGSYTTVPSGGTSEQTEERWLDQNATPLLINRFNGTLVKGE